ncbi:MAG: ABC transporter ATP-binding protein [Chloroflexi bacterium]|jgi:ABC-type lipoprotein export system ATPase subunit|nr:ABC transporter ATP-binding protein [Chloroflexota bacterium]
MSVHQRIQSENPTALRPASPPRAAPLVSVRGLTKTYETPAGVFHALRGVDLDVSSGEFVSVVGRSGCGKSTLVNMITGLDRPTSGEVAVGGVDLIAMSESERSRWRGSNLGIVFQFFQLLPMLTLLQNVMLPMDLANYLPLDHRPARARQLLDAVGLAAVADEPPGSVSGGQQQCAAVARALATDPPLMVADEPTGNLDSSSAERILTLFDALHREGKTIIMVTHDPQMAARASRRLTMNDGWIVADDLL